MTLAEAITPASVKRWMVTARKTCRASTLVQLLTGLAHAAWMLEPDTDWRWVARHRLRPTPTQMREEAKPKLLLDVPRLVTAALRRAEELLSGPVTIEAALEARDLTIVVVAALTALRVGNLAGLTLGRHLSEVGGAFRIEIPAAEMKTRRHFTTILPDLGTPLLRAYLDVWRPALLGDHPDDGALWRRGDGRPLDRAAHTALFQRVTRALTGMATGPHAVRHAAATGLLTDDPGDLARAAAALGHKNGRTVREFYDRSGSDGVHRVWGAIRARIGGT